MGIDMHKCPQPDPNWGCCGLPLKAIRTPWPMCFSVKWLVNYFKDGQNFNLSNTWLYTCKTEDIPNSLSFTLCLVIISKFLHANTHYTYLILCSIVIVSMPTLACSSKVLPRRAANMNLLWLVLSFRLVHVVKCTLHTLHCQVFVSPPLSLSLMLSRPCLSGWTGRLWSFTQQKDLVGQSWRLR